MGRATQELLGSLDQGLDLAQGTTSYVWAGDRIVRGWAIELLLAGLLIPFVVVVVDLFARCRRLHVSLLPALRSLRSRLFFWLFAGGAFYVFGLLGAWPSGAPRPPNPALPVAGGWPVFALIALVVVLAFGWLVGRQRLVPPAAGRRRGTPRRRCGRAARAVSRRVAHPGNKSLRVDLRTAGAARWLWLPQVRLGARPARWLIFAVGLLGPAIVLVSLATRYQLGLDAPWYLLELVAVGYVHVPAV
jgi:hypothetical protein